MSTSNSVSSKTCYTWTSPYTYSLRKGKHGDAPKMNRRPLRNSYGSSCWHLSLCNPTKTCNFGWKWMQLGMQPAPSYLNCARTTSGPNRVYIQKHLISQKELQNP